jgi:phage terminase large subunit-like protein
MSEKQQLRLLRSLCPNDTAAERSALRHDWRFWGRGKQQEPPGTWTIWLVLAGRGFGKTRTGAEWFTRRMMSGRYGSGAIVGSTAADVRDIQVEGESGLLNVGNPALRPKYEPSKRRLTWPNGAVASTFSGDEPDTLRGPNRGTAWVDELAKYRYAQETWDNLEMVLRTGSDPRVCITTTPRPTPLIRMLMKDPDTVITRGSTDENRGNLAPAFVERIYRRYEGTRLGRQELEAELLDDAPGSLWKRVQLDALRVRRWPELQRIVVGVDPQGKKSERELSAIQEMGGEGQHATGIVVVGRAVDGHLYVLDDRTINGLPPEWALAAVNAYRRWEADRLVVEINHGGDMVTHTIGTVDATVPMRKVTASRGKWVRAEPVAMLYEQGRVHHVGSFAELEDEQCSFTPDGLVGGGSPNRVDALVWAITDLALSGEYTADAW